MFNIKKNRCLKVMASLLLGSLVVFGGGNYAYADFDYSEHHYKTYNNTKEDVSGKEAYLARVYSKNPELKNSVPANDYILELQKIAADANGLKIGTYTKAGDYKKVVQPVILAIGRKQTSNFGNYQIFLGTESLRDISGYEYGNDKQSRNPYMDAGIILVIGHEIGHGVLNHGTVKPGESHGRITAHEEDADRVAWYTLEKTSDFGWGYAFNVKDAYRTDNCNEEYIKKQTNNKLWISGTSPSDVQYKLNINGKWYNARNLYNILIESNYKLKHTTNESTYKDFTIALGQLGFIYSKEKKIDVSKITIVPENKYTYKKSKLIYRSSNMPNGYKTIAFFNSSANDIAAFWNKGKYTEKEGYSYKDAYNDLDELKSEKENTSASWEKALIIAIKYAGIDIFNGHNYFH